MSSSRQHILLRQTLVCIATCVWLCIPDVCAVTNYLSVGADGGLAADCYSGDSRTWGYGAMAGVQLGYELQHDGLLFSVGIGVEYSNARINIRTQESLTGLDDGDTQSLNDYDNRYSVLRTTDNTWKRHLWALRVPLMLGYQLNGFYAKAGVVVSLQPFLGKVIQSESVNDVADYEVFYDDFNHHPLAPIGHQESVNSTVVRFPLGNISPAVELGYNYTLDKNQLLRMGLFAECGVLSLLPAESSPYEPSLQRITPVQVGVRVTWLYALPAGRTKACRCIKF